MAKRGKTIELYLIDGEGDGRILMLYKRNWRDDYDGFKTLDK